MSLGSVGLLLDATRELGLAEAGTQSLDMTLDRVVAAIANCMETDVGSLYTYERSTNSLVLAATVGLLQSCVGNLRMQLHEGLVGLVAEEKAPVVLANAPDHPRFKFFAEADEDEYQSFLGVPILDNEKVAGVLVVQTIEARTFTDAEVSELVSIAQLVGSRLQDFLR